MAPLHPFVCCAVYLTAPIGDYAACKSFNLGAAAVADPVDNQVGALLFVEPTLEFGDLGPFGTAMQQNIGVLTNRIRRHFGMSSIS